MISLLIIEEQVYKIKFTVDYSKGKFFDKIISDLLKKIASRFLIWTLKDLTKNRQIVTKLRPKV